MIRGSVGSNAYRHFHASIDGVSTDTMKDGQFACAYFVSSLLTIFGGLGSPSFVVESVEKKLGDGGWLLVETPEVGDVVVYEKIKIDGQEHAHIGFYVGNEKVVSNSSTRRTPVQHDWLYRDSTERAITAIYRGRHLLPDTTKVID
jgi:hypothetical protein